MAKLYVTEYSGTGDLVAQGNIAAEPENTTQVVSFTGTAGVSSAFNASTAVVRVQPDGICSLVFSTYTAGAAVDPSATTSNRRMVAGQTEYFKVPAGKGFKVSAITNT